MNIKFRGKRIDDGEWVYGYYYAVDNGDHKLICHITDSTQINDYKVISKTVSQYVTENGYNKIYEGDIVELHNWGIKDNIKIGTAVVEWNEQFHKWDFTMIDGDYIDDEYDMWRTTPKVIGNIFDNPDYPGYHYVWV